MSPRTSSGQASWPYEIVPIRTILSPYESGRKSLGENYQALTVMGERYPTWSLESDSNQASERRMCNHGATKPQGSRLEPRP